MSTTSLDSRLAEAIELREQGHVEHARDLLLELHRQLPNHAQVNLQCAWAHDKLGLETEAVPFYERALALGLDGDDLKDALLGLGSTYRTIGDYEKALITLDRGVEHFPGDQGIQVFRAMALYNNGRAKEACETLLRLLAETTSDPDIRSYRGAIDIYAADLDRTWP